MKGSEFAKFLFQVNVRKFITQYFLPSRLDDQVQSNFKPMIEKEFNRRSNFAGFDPRFDAAITRITGLNHK